MSAPRGEQIDALRKGTSKSSEAQETKEMKEKGKIVGSCAPSVICMPYDNVVHDLREGSKPQLVNRTKHCQRSLDVSSSNNP